MTTTMCKYAYEWIIIHLSYIRVIIIGLMSVGAISGIYSWLCNVDSIQIFKHRAGSASVGAVIDGISCSMAFREGTRIYCNNIAYQMANLSITHPEWQCESFADYSSKSLMTDMPIFRNSLTVLFIFASLYGIFAIIHDCTLIWYRDKLTDLTFHPMNENDFYLATNFLRICNLQKFCELMQDKQCCLACLLCILFFIYSAIIGYIMLVLFVVDIFLMLCIYPIFSYCFKIERNNINGFSYVSASFVGVSRWILAASTSIMVFGSLTMTKSIPSLDTIQCSCACNYVLHEADFYEFLFYSLPIKVANKMNPVDCSGSMMKPQNTTSNALLIMNQYTFNEINEGKEYDIDNSQETERNKIVRVWRSMTILLLFYSGFFVFLILIVFGVINPYQYPLWAVVVVFVASGIVFITVGVIVGILCDQGHDKVDK
eukprot:120830_1